MSHHERYSNVQLFIDGAWRDGSEGQSIEIFDPATGEQIGTVAKATKSDLDAAVASSERGFQIWSGLSAYERSKIMRKAADLLRERKAQVARLMTREQGKPLAEAQGEIGTAADVIDWFAEEGRRAYGQVIPSRMTDVAQMSIKSPVGVVAAFSPWNFPINQIVRKLSASLAAGCSIIVKAPEETPASPAELIRAFADAGLPDGVVNLVFGNPAEISQHLISHPTVRKISFTGSTQIGKELASLAGRHMKRATMELGGHAPAIVLNDADIDKAVQVLSFSKFRNAGQICVSPTRILVEREVYEPFLDKFVGAANAIKVGRGLDGDTQMGPLANERRVIALETLVADAVERGAELRAGGRRIGNVGHFFQPTVLAAVPTDAKIMNEEPFGPLAIINPVDGLDNAVEEANRLPFGLASYAFTSSLAAIRTLSRRVEAGMLTVNHNGLALPEVPFGGVKDSGYGDEGGSEAINSYLVTKFVSVA